MFELFPIRYLLPNAVTASSIALACGAIVQSHHGNHGLAAWMIVWCVLLDKADGALARLVNASSEFGVQLDSLADFVAFCVAPALMVYMLIIGDARYADLFNHNAYEVILVVACLLYVLAGGIRLARFNVVSNTGGSMAFQGLSSTFAGFIVVTFLLSAEQHAWAGMLVASTPLLLIICAVFMLSNLRLPKSLPARMRGLLPVLVILYGITYGFGIFRVFPLVLFILALTYPVLGFVLGARSSEQPYPQTQQDNHEIQ